MYKTTLATVVMILFSSVSKAQDRPIIFSSDPLIFADENSNEHVEITGIFFNSEQNMCGIEINYVPGATGRYLESAGDWFQKIKLSPRLKLSKFSFPEEPDGLTLTQVSIGAKEFCWPNS